MKLAKGEPLNAQDLRIVEDAAATVPGFAEGVSAEVADKDHSLMTANDIATLDGGVRGEELAANGTLSAFQGDMVPADEKQLSLLESLANSTEERELEEAILEEVEKEEEEEEDHASSTRRRRRRRSKKS